MNDEDYKKLNEIYNILISGRIDLARSMLEELLSINPKEAA
jgi:hypothetical protein